MSDEQTDKAITSSVSISVSMPVPWSAVCPVPSSQILSPVYMGVSFESQFRPLTQSKSCTSNPGANYISPAFSKLTVPELTHINLLSSFDSYCLKLHLVRKHLKF